jgi:hypothetical protein
MNDIAKSASQISEASSVEIPVTNPRGLSPVYANNLGVSGTMMDFTLFFLETWQIPGENGPIQKNELKALVTLPIPSALQMIQILRQVVKQSTERMEAATAAAVSASEKTE